MQPDAFVRQATEIESVYDINPGTNTMGYRHSIATTWEHNGRGLPRFRVRTVIRGALTGTDAKSPNLGAAATDIASFFQGASICGFDGI
jgi:hypothetical protein